MKELANVRQIAGERLRRWFSSPDFDLIVWLDEDGRMNGFELCYDKRIGECSISWRPDSGYRHQCMDDGEQRAGKYKATPLHTQTGHFDLDRLYREFAKVSLALPIDVANYVLRMLRGYPGFMPQQV